MPSHGEDIVTVRDFLWSAAQDDSVANRFLGGPSDDSAHQALAALNRLAAAFHDRAWRPIETAPKDGTRIQLAVIDMSGNILSDTGNWVEGDTHEEWDEVDDGIRVKLWEEQEDGHWSTNYCLDALEEPTHWQPLPSAPDAEQTGE